MAWHWSSIAPLIVCRLTYGGFYARNLFLEAGQQPLNALLSGSVHFCHDGADVSLVNLRGLRRVTGPDIGSCSKIRQLSRQSCFHFDAASVIDFVESLKAAGQDVVSPLLGRVWPDGCK